VIARFSYKALLINLLAGMTLISTAEIVCDFLAEFVVPTTNFDKIKYEERLAACLESSQPTKQKKRQRSKAKHNYKLE
jgi:hypothetical protein